MNALAARRMAQRLTVPFARGADTLQLTPQATPNPARATIATYDFADHTAQFDSRPDPRYVLLALREVAVETAVTVDYAVVGPPDPVTRTRQPLRTGRVALTVATGTPAGASFALDLGADEGPDTQLTALSVVPAPGSASVGECWGITALLGNLAKLLWVMGGERDLIRAQMARVVSQRHVAAALRASLDLLGADLGVPRFPPLPYTFDADAVALYHLDDQSPAGGEVDQVVDAMAQYGMVDHPGQNVGRLAKSGAIGRFGSSFAFRDANAAVRIADHAEFAVPAGGSFTIECFVKPDQGAPDCHVIAKHANPNEATMAGWAISVGDFGRGIPRNVRLLLSDAARQVTVFADQPLRTDQFTHLAGVIDRGSGEARLFLDGVVRGRRSLGGVGALTNGEAITIGLTANMPYRGLVDEVRLSRTARATFNPVSGESDDAYRRRLAIFARWTVPTPAALLDVLNQAVGPINGDAMPLILNDANATLIGGSLPVQVTPQQLAPGECIDADGNRNVTEAAVNGLAAAETSFDAAFLRTHNDARVDYAPAPPRKLNPGELPPDTHRMQHVTAAALNRLLSSMGGGRLRIVSGFDPRANDLRQVGRGLLLTHSALNLGRLAALASIAGFSAVCYRADLGAVAASVAAGDYLEIVVTGGNATPSDGFDLLLGQTLQLGFNPPLRTGTPVHWLTIACGQGRAQNTTSADAATITWQATAPGDLTVKVEATVDKHVATGTRAFRIGIAQLADGASIGNDGTLGVTADIAGEADPFFDPTYLVTHADARVAYGSSVNNRRMQPAVARSLDALLQSITASGVAGTLTVLRAWTPGGSDRYAVGRALTLQHAGLGGGRLAALAFAAGFTYVAREGDQVQIEQAPADLITVSGSMQVAEGASTVLSMQPVASPVGVALGNGAVYVANSGTDTVSVLDPATGAVRHAIKVGWQPSALALSPDGKRLYSADRAGNSVTAIDVATGTVTATIAVAGGPVALAHHPTQARLYVACSMSGAVALLDTAALSVSATTAVGNGPTAIAITPNGTEVWLALATDRKVAVLTTAPFQVAATIAVPQPPQGIALSPDGAHGYLTFPTTGQFAVLNVTARTAGPLLMVGPGTTPGTVVVDAVGTVYVAANSNVGGRVFVYKADGTPAGSAGVGREPGGVAVTTTLLAVANTSGNTVSLLNPQRIGAAGPGTPALLLGAPIGSGLGERLSWAVRAGTPALATLTSTTAAQTTLRGLRAGPAAVSAVYTLQNNPEPYTYEVRLNPALEAANAVLRKDQYDLAMNVLNALHPVGVEVTTRALREHVIELRNEDFDLFPAYTFPDFRGRGPLPRRQ